MLIKNLFERDIFRPINGVVKADQLDDSSVWQELDEFVITRELDQHFRKFISLVSRSRGPGQEPRPRRQDGHLDFGLLRLRQVALPEGAVVPAPQPHAHPQRPEQAGGRVLREQGEGRHALWATSSGPSPPTPMSSSSTSTARPTTAASGRDLILRSSSKS